MSNEPMAGGSLDPELLAAYIDKRLTPEQRAAVEAQLAADPDNHAVLVETMKALDAVKVPEAHARRWVIGGGVLAAAAAIALVVWTQPDLLRSLRGQPVEPQLERLVAAVGKQRYFEPRLTGGFEFGPLRSESRGQGSTTENLALLSAAAELQKQADGARRASTLRGWGIAQLLLRDYDAAVTTLREAIDIEPTAQAHSDLAAALLARADGQGSTADLPAALDAATAAIRIDPRLAEAHYNRALALERLGLSDQAASAWREYLEVDAAGPWADEARARLSRLGSAQLNVDPYAPLSAGVAFAGAGDQNLDPARIRFLAERQWFVRLCDTQLSRADREQLGERLAAFRRATGDSLLLDAFNAGTSAGTCDGYESYARAVVLLDDDNLAEGGKLMRSAARLLHAGNNPLGWWADYHLASILNVTRQYADAERELTRIVSTASAHHYRSLEAHALWTLGVVRGSTDRFRESLLVLIPALEKAGQSAEPVLEGRLQNQIADIYEYLGLTRSAWPHRKAALTIAARVPNRRLRHSVYGSMVAASTRRDLPHTTRAFLEAQYQANLIGAPPASRLTLLLRQIEADLSTRDLDVAAVRLQQADATLALLSQDPRLETLEGRVRLAKARHALYQAQPAAAVDLATDALQAFTRGRELQKADALLLRARALQQSGRGREALDDIGGVLTTLQERRGSGESLFGTPELQDVKDGIDELLDGDIDVESALALTDALAGVIAPAATMPRGLAAGDTLCFKVLDSRIRAWWITPRGVTERSLPLTRADAVRLVKSVQLAIAGTDRDDARRRLEAAYGSLLAPFRDDITGAASFRIVADWPLDSVPFSALLDPVTHRFVAEDHAVAFAPAVTGFHQPAEEQPRDVDLLVVADPSRTYADDGLVPLKWASKEADAVSRLYNRTVVLRGQEATPRELFRLAPQARVVHVAAHAIVDRTDGRRSRLLLSGSNGEGDVFGEEFANQKWSGIDVVVLAACATAEADARPTSPLTLATQVLAAGPRFVIATLKPIDDRLASIFFAELHRLLATGVPAPEALQRAQIHFIEQDRSSMAGDVAMWSMWTPVAVFSL